MNSRVFKGVLSVISLLSAFSTPALALDWQIKDLGILPGAISSSGTALNDQGQVAGDMYYGTYTDEIGRVIAIQYSFLSDPNGGSLHLIDHGEITDGYHGFRASEVNNSGQVIGSAVQGSSTNFGWVTGPNGQGLQQVEFFNQGIDINNSGAALFQRTIGGATVSTGGGTPQLIYESPDADFPTAINDAGQVALAAFYRYNPPQTTGAVWTEGVGLQPIFFQGGDTIFFDINNSGQVLGQVANDPFRLLVLNPVDGAFNIIDLPGTGHLRDNLEFETSGLPRFNDAGQIVGQYLLDGTTFSFLASATTGEVINLSTEQDLIVAGWSNIMASDINNLGQISGTGIINGNSRAFLLTPVPEPETYAMMLAGLSLLGFMRHRKSAATRQL